MSLEDVICDVYVNSGKGERMYDTKENDYAKADSVPLKEKASVQVRLNDVLSPLENIRVNLQRILNDEQNNTPDGVNPIYTVEDALRSVEKEAAYILDLTYKLMDRIGTL